MKNLEIMGVQEMDAVQMLETDGGFIPAVILVCLLLGGCVVRREAMPGPGGAGGSW